MPEHQRLLSEEFLVRLIKRSWESSAFRRKLLSSPKEAMEDEFGLGLPPDVTVHVHEETDRVIHLVLPDRPETGPEASSIVHAPQTRRQLEHQLRQKSLRDERFRSLLFSVPKKAIEEEYGEAIHPSIRIHVHEQSDRVLHIVLPWNPVAMADGSIDDLELEHVAGGVMVNCNEALNTNICTGA
jgi:hypothetical protein